MALIGLLVVGGLVIWELTCNLDLTSSGPTSPHGDGAEGRPQPPVTHLGRHPGHALSDANLRYAFGHGDDGWPSYVAQVREPSGLPDISGLPGAAMVDRVVHDLVGELTLGREWPPPQPHPPVAVLLHGPSEVAMTAVAHTIARRLDALLVHVMASQVVPSYGSGSQPLVATAVWPARRRRRSVVFIDELETLVAPARRNPRWQRAIHDLLGECLKLTYGPAPAVIATMVTPTGAPPGQLIRERFQVVLEVDAPDLERAIVRRALAMPPPGHISAVTRRPLPPVVGAIEVR